MSKKMAKAVSQMNEMNKLRPDENEGQTNCSHDC